MLDGERERIHAGVVTQSMEGDGMDSLWRAMNVIKGGQGTSAEAKELREKVVTAVEERWQSREMQEPLPQGEAGWQAYVRKLLQGIRMGGLPEVEAWAVKSRYRVKVYREMKDGASYRKIQEYGGEMGVHVGILWKKTRVYEVVWEPEEAESGSTAREAEGEGLCRGAQARVSVGSEGGHSVASGESRPSTCGARSAESTEGNEVQQQRKAAWAWKRREEALQGAREKTGDSVLKEHMYGKDVNTLWEVLCSLEGRPNSEEEVQRIRQGVATRVESRYNMGKMEECLPREEVSWQKYIQRTMQGGRMGGSPEVEAWAAEGGLKIGGLQGDKKRGQVQKIGGVWGGNPAGCGKPVDQAKSPCGAVGFQGSQE